MSKKRITALFCGILLLVTFVLPTNMVMAEDESAGGATSLVTVPFTDAGPFMPAVSVLPQVQKAAQQKGGIAKAAVAPETRAAGDGAGSGEGTEPDRLDNEGVVTDKTVTPNESEGTYTLRMETYVTGTTTTTTTTTTSPADIVLVLDQSGSMRYNFDGEETSINTERRQYAMKQAVNAFIDAVEEKYNAGNSDHRIAIVTYGSSASNLRGWTAVDADGATSLHNAINGLSDNPSGATNAGAGMNNAATLMGSGYDYIGSNTTRQKVVIMFTDGVPTTSNDFDKGVANTAISNAKTLKDGGATVYTVGIFNGANPSQLHGDKWDYLLYSDITCSGNPESYWGGSWGAGLFGGANDFDVLDVPAGNRFLNYLSSNFAGATEIGITKGSYNPGSHFLSEGDGWRIDNNATRTAAEDKNYYLTANNTASLNGIFTTISENIQTGGATVTLGTETIIQDTISDYFTLPEGIEANDIVVKTADCNSFNGDTPVWTNEQAVNLPVIVGKITIEGKERETIQVTGFDFSENWVGKDTATGAAHPGKKLIIEVDVKPKEGFLGGNDVPTNGPGSGIIVDDEPIEDFDEPAADVTIAIGEVTIPETNVYLGAFFAQTVEEEDIYAGIEVTVVIDENPVKLDFSKATDEEHPYGLEPWQIDFLDISIIATALDNGSFENITEDVSYTVEVKIQPKTLKPGDDIGYASDTGTIHVFKPHVTFKDSIVWYGGVAPSAATDFSANYVKTEWWNSDGTERAGDEGVEMFGDAPILTFTYPTGTSQIVDGKIASKQDIPVNVDITMPMGVNQTMENVNGFTKFLHEACDPACEWTAPTTGGDPAFLLHVNTCSLTINKTGGAEGEPYVFSIFKDGSTNPYTYASITANDEGKGSVMISELPIGSYSIAENTAWSWRYTPTYVLGGSNTNTITLSADNANGTLQCTNISNNKNKWLNGYSLIAQNIYGVDLSIAD